MRNLSLKMFIGLGVLVALALAFFISPLASSSPDGLEKVAADKGFDADVEDHTFADGPLADYAVEGVDDEGLSTGVAGIIGVTITFAAAGGLFLVLRAGRGRRHGDAGAGATPAPPLGLRH